MTTECPKCSNAMNQVHGQTHHHCAGCNTFAFDKAIDETLEPIKATGTETDFTCPKCVTTNLEVGTIAETQAAFCGNCRGYVIDSGSFGFLATSLRQAYKGPDDKPVLIDQKALNESVNCPACLTKMHAHPYYGPGNSVINSCSECKLTWLDHGELSTIIRAPGARQPAAAPVDSRLFKKQCDKKIAQLEAQKEWYSHENRHVRNRWGLYF